MDVVAPARDDLGAPERRVGIARSHREIGCHVALDPLVQERRTGGDGGVSVGHGIERIIRDLEGLGAVLRGVAALGHDGGDRLTDVANLVARQRQLPARAERRMIDDGRDIAEASLGLEIGRGEHADDGGEGPRRGGIDPEARVGIDAAGERHVTGAGHAQVVHIEGLAAQQPRILEAPEGPAGKFVGHVVRRGPQL